MTRCTDLGVQREFRLRNDGPLLFPLHFLRRAVDGQNGRLGGSVPLVCDALLIRLLPVGEGAPNLDDLGCQTFEDR